MRVGTLNCCDCAPVEWSTPGGMHSGRQYPQGYSVRWGFVLRLIVFTTVLLCPCATRAEEPAREETSGRAVLDDVIESGTGDETDFPEVLRRLPEGEQTRELSARETPTGAVNGAAAQVVPDRWRTPFPIAHRYPRGTRHPDQPYESRTPWDPYYQQVLKGDYPIFGTDTFLNLRVSNHLQYERREVPASAWNGSNTAIPGAIRSIGDPHQQFLADSLRLQVSVFQGDASYQPVDWQIRVTPVLNRNYLEANELGVVSADPASGKVRNQGDIAFDEWFAEWRLADLNTDFDFMSVRAGSQWFVSDFRGLIFADTNRAVRLFGTAAANRHQYNLVVLDQAEKDTNSFLNTFRDRHQNTLIANYYIQDFVTPGYTVQFSLHYNDDQADQQQDDNGFPVRPAPVGSTYSHDVRAAYFGFAGDGHLGVLNISHAFYHVEGTDEFNALQGQRSQIRANLAAVELSLDRDWMRFRTSVLYASGDSDLQDGQASGFDAITDNPNFAGGQFSFWQRQQIRLLGVNLTQRESLLPNLRPGKFQGQANFVNPGLRLLNAGVDFELTPKLRTVTNVNLLWFDQTETLEMLASRQRVARRIGTDLSVGLEYRPLLNDHVILTTGLASLIPGQGFIDVFEDDLRAVTPLHDQQKPETLHALFMDLMLTW